jgi:hypothetical protein
MSADEQVVNPAYRVFVSYIDKSREYYLAQAFGNPYRWAHNQDSPFTPLEKPLAESRIGLVTTATLTDDHATPAEDRPPKVAYAAPVDPLPAALYTMDLAWDKEATHTDDLDSFFPAQRLAEAAASGRIGSVSPRFYGVPTEYSQRRTNEVDAAAVLEFCRDDGVDAAILVAL